MKVLVTSASRKIPLLHAVAGQLADVDPGAEVVAGDADPRCLAAFAWPAFLTLPPLDDPAAAGLPAILQREGITHLVPTRDGELGWIAERSEEFAAHGIACLVSRPAAIARCQDKLAFSETLRDAGLPGIPTSTTLTLAPRQVVKERRGSGSRGLVLDVDAPAARAAATGLSEPVFQPFVPGAEVSIDAYRARDGRVIGSVARTRDLVIGGESQVTTTTDPAPYAGLVHDVLNVLDVTGHAVLQVIDSPDGPVVVECNARLGGASTLSLAVGLLSLPWFVRESRGDDPALFRFEPEPWPRRLIRVPSDAIDDPRP